MTGYSQRDAYDAGYYDGMKSALRIVRQTELAPQTRAGDQQFGAAKRRITRRLADALARNGTTGGVR